MAKSWYIVHTYAGYEQKIERTIRKLLEENKIDPAVVGDVRVPMRNVVVDTGNGKLRKQSDKVLPGYIMIEMDLPQIGWKTTCSAIRAIEGVTGFVGTKPLERPRPISNDEAKGILQLCGEIKGEKLPSRQNFDIDDNVKITEGPFATFSGVVEEVNTEKNKLRVNVQIFGRVTPVEVDMTQVEKI